MRIKKYLALGAIAFALGFGNSAQAQCGWESLGASENDYLSLKRGYNANITMDNSGNPIVAFRDEAYSNKITVRKLVNNKWQTLGTAGFANGEISKNALAIASDGSLYLAIRDIDKSYKASVFKFAGNSWTTVDTQGFTASQTNSAPAIALDTNNVPYISFSEQSNNNKLAVMKYNGSAWEMVGSAGISSGETYQHSLTFDKNNKLYVAYIDEGLSYKAIIKNFNGSDWMAVGGSASSQDVEILHLAIDNNNDLYCAMTGNESGYRSLVKKFDGTSWDNNTDTLTSYYSYTSAFKIGTNNALYVSYQDAAKDKIYVQKKDGNNWSVLGTSDISVTYSYWENANLAIGNNNTPFVVYSDDFLNNKVSVKKFENNKWSFVGTESPVVYWPTIALDTSDIPYINYTDFEDSTVRVQKWDGSKWAQVGSQVSPGLADNSRIAISKDNTVYVAYRDGLDSLKRLSVKKWDGTNWVSVGPKHFSIGANNYINLKINSKGVPYVVYVTKDQSLTVRKFDGTNWTIVGSDNFTNNGRNDFVSLAFDQNDVPYVTTSVYNSNQKASVWKWDTTNSTWGLVGSASFTAGAALYPTLTFDNNDVLYISYSDFGTNNTARGQVTVKKFDGNTWETVGTERFTRIRSNYIELVFDKNNTPHVGFSTTSGTMVMSFDRNTSTWDSLTTEAIAKGAYPYFTMAINDKDEFITVAANKLVVNKSVKEIDKTVNVSGGSITANQGSATYQWLDCDNNNTAISGATERTFKPTKTGNYAVRITLGNCTETSACQKVVVDPSGINTPTANSITLFPNPAKNQITVNGLQSQTAYALFDMTGRVVLRGVVAPSSDKINVSTLSEGIYIFRIKGMSQKIMINK